jgi:hypothetical protein
MSVELHLPDLPEVPISLGPLRAGAPQVAMPWHLRAARSVVGLLPLLADGAAGAGQLVAGEELTPAAAHHPDTPGRVTRPRLHDDDVFARAL